MKKLNGKFHDNLIFPVTRDSDNVCHRPRVLRKDLYVKETNKMMAPERGV